MSTAILFKQLPTGNVQCAACHHYCRLKLGQTGICGVRQNINGKLQLLVYGQAAAVQIDPIEKKPLYHFLPGSKVFSFGTLGCNFSCRFCQNWDISQVSKQFKIELSKRGKLSQLAAKIKDYGYELEPQRIVDYCLEKQLPTIAYTYNEPSIFFEYAYDTARLAHHRGLRNIFVSNGYASPEAIAKISPYLDAINIDLKSFRDGFYRRLCGARLEPVLDSIRRYQQTGVWLELTTLLIPGVNDSEQELKDLAEFIVSLSPDIPWHLSRFYPAYQMSDQDMTPRQSLELAYEIGRATGLRYIYLGNIVAGDKENTYCPDCGSLLIARDNFYINRQLLEDGCCPTCHYRLPGVWQGGNDDNQKTAL